MDHEIPFRILVLAGFIGTLFIAVPYRVRSWASKEPLDRRQEGAFILATLRPIALLLWLGIFAYMINPRWMAWSSLPLPDWLRWTGALVFVAELWLMSATLRALGPNLTDTVVTRQEHTLVTSGPYRWVRHPFYVVMALLVLAIGLISANWFILLAGAVVFALLAVRSNKEEENLLKRFGEPYQRYRENTGRFLPKPRSSTP